MGIVEEAGKGGLDPQNRRVWDIGIHDHAVKQPAERRRVHGRAGETGLERAKPREWFAMVERAPVVHRLRVPGSRAERRTSSTGSCVADSEPGSLAAGNELPLERAEVQKQIDGSTLNPG